jgi:proteasome beta subunit
MNLEQAVQFALRLLLVASEFDSATGGVNPETQTFATIKILNEQGVQDVSFVQQAESLKL